MKKCLILMFLPLLATASIDIKAVINEQLLDSTARQISAGPYGCSFVYYQGKIDAYNQILFDIEDDENVSSR